jgi:hypothetical protein
MMRTHLLSSAILSLAALAAACDSPSAPAPTTPTAPTTTADARTGDPARTGSVQISGTVGRVSGTCPAIRFVVRRVIVETNRATVFNGGPCAAVLNGVGVVVTGTRQGDGSLAASAVTTPGTSTRPR